MAKTACNPVVGQRVYRAYRPLNAGVISRIESRNGHVTEIRVKWLDGTETAEPPVGLQDFDALLLEAEQKLFTHQNTRLKLDRKVALEGGNTVSDYRAFLKHAHDNGFWAAYHASKEDGYDPSINWRKLMETERHDA